jgi:hypothetical protein
VGKNMTNEKSSLDKNLIADVVSKAMDNYLKTESDEESVVEDAVEPVESTELDDVVVNDDIKETSDVQEEVEEIVEEQVLQSGDYNFLGLDINITDDEEGKFNVVIKKDDKEKVSVLDAVNLPNIFGLIEEFFTEIVIDEDVVEEDVEDVEEENKEESVDVTEDQVLEESFIAKDDELDNLEDTISVLSNDTILNSFIQYLNSDQEQEFYENLIKDYDLDCEVNDDIDKLRTCVLDLIPEDDFVKNISTYLSTDELKNFYKSLITDNDLDADLDYEDREVTMASLRVKYEDKINAIFEHGMLAKELALDMVKDNILAGTVKELVKKSKEKDAIIASKKNDLKKATKSFIVANKYYDSLNKVHTLLSASIKEIETDLTAGSYDSKTAKKIMDKYNSILSKVLVAEDVDSLNSIMNTITKTQAIVSSYKTDIASKKKAILESKTMNSDKKEINTAQSVIEKKNVMNSDGWKNNKTLLAKQHRYDSIEEMSAELLKIAGV